MDFSCFNAKSSFNKKNRSETLNISTFPNNWLTYLHLKLFSKNITNDKKKLAYNLETVRRKYAQKIDKNQ